MTQDPVHTVPSGDLSDSDEAADGVMERMNQGAPTANAAATAVHAATTKAAEAKATAAAVLEATTKATTAAVLAATTKAAEANAAATAVLEATTKAAEAKATAAAVLEATTKAAEAKATAAAVLEATTKAAPAEGAEEVRERVNLSPTPSTSSGTMVVYRPTSVAPPEHNPTGALGVPVNWAWTQQQWPATPEGWKELRRLFTLQIGHETGPHQHRRD